MTSLMRWQRLLRPDYLLDPLPPPLGRLWPLFLLLGLGFLCGLAWSVHNRTRGRLAWWEGFFCGAGLLLVAARFAHVPGLSARVWPYLAAFLACVTATGYAWTRGPGGVTRRVIGRVLVCRPRPADTRHVCAWAASLLPLLYPLAVWSVRRLIPSGLEAQVAAGLVPDPWILPFDPVAAGVAGIAYTLLCLAALAHGRLAQPEQELRAHMVPSLLTRIDLGRTLFALTLIWAAVTLLRGHTLGVTGSDPYAYAQMAVDLARRASPLHQFSLFPLIRELDVPWYPVVHVGYSLPLDAAGHAGTVWPIGWPLLLAVPFSLFGEPALYLATPLIGLLSLIATWWWIERVALQDSPQATRGLTAGIAVLLVATSFEQLDRLLVPMADAASQLFSTLVIGLGLLTWRAAPRQATRLGLLTGICFGALYLIRHTQLLMLVPCLAIVALAPQRRQVALAFLAGVLPFGLGDLYYHWLLSGHPLMPESPESFLFGAQHVATSARAVLGEALRRNEFGILWPFTLLGAGQLTRRAPRLSLVLWAMLAGLLAIHLPYAALRLRDLLALYPLLALWTAYGMVVVWQPVAAWAQQSAAGRVVAAVTLFSLLFLVAARSDAVLDRVRVAKPASFGFVDTGQRAAFERLAALTPVDSVIGCTLNSGAVDLLSQRDTLRPAGWQPAEFVRVAAALQAQGRTFYLLDDGVDLAPVLDLARARFGLIEVARLDVPLYGDAGPDSGGLYRLGRLK